MEHLSLEIFDLATKENPKPTDSKYAVLDPDQSITVTDTSEIFASGDVWSHSFTLNVFANAHVFGTAGDIHGSRLHEQVDKRRARLWVDQLPLYLGYLKLDDEAEVDEDGNVDVRFESGQKTFDGMIEGAKASQVPMMGDVRIGVALWRKRWVKFSVNMSASIAFDKDDRYYKACSSNNGEVKTSDGSSVISFEGDGEETSLQEYPRMVFPKGEFLKTDHSVEHVDCLNTDNPYSENEYGAAEYPYCNVALCYQKYGYDKKDKNGNVYKDYNSEPEAQRGYEYMPANRVNSAPNFYVIYWIRCLMKHLGIYVEENQMMDVEDLRRLFFVNTRCEHKVPKKISESEKEGIGRYAFSGNRLVPEKLRGENEGRFDKYVNTQESGFVAKVNSLVCVDDSPSNWPDVTHVNINIDKINEWSTEEKNQYLAKNSFLYDAYATGDCFPDVDISEVVSAIENGFGIRFLFRDSYQRVRIVLLRNVFNSEDVQDIECDITSDEKVENNIRGFRLTYGNSEDTHFYYKGFADKLPHMKTLWPDTSDKHDYSQWDLNALYEDVINKVTAFNKTCYVTPENGNAYGVKVDKDAKRYDDLHPSLFEYAGFMDAEDGDCTGEEDTIEEINVGFTPAIMNDLNMEDERGSGGNQPVQEQKFALFVDEKMRPRRPDLDDLEAPESYNDPDAFYDVDNKLYAKTESGDYVFKDMMSEDGIVKPGEFAIASDMLAARKNLKARIRTSLNVGLTFRIAHWDVGFDIDGHISEGYRLYLQDNYDPNDDGVAPVETHDWGLTLGIMRGSGSDAYVSYQSDPDDGEGNDSWDIAPGSSVTAHPDTCDSYGNLWDYNNSVFVADGGTAIQQMQRLWPDSNIDLVYNDRYGLPTIRDIDTYISGASLQTVEDNNGNRTALLFATTLGTNGHTVLYTGKIKDYAKEFSGMSPEEMRQHDTYFGFHILVESGSSAERMQTLLELQRRAFRFGDMSSDPMVIDDNGVGSVYGRFSLKLRAEKPNPYFDPKKEETHYDPQHPQSNTNPRYLHIDNENLQRRGLCDQFYKEYSYWIRNARVLRRTVHMELAQLLAIDKTKRVRVGDVTGFVRKMQYSVSNKTGLGEVTMEIMYI